LFALFTRISTSLRISLVFIQEVTCRAFLVADAHKRRTISKQDIAKALAKSDHFDFLIDVVPRDELERAKTQKIINSAFEAAAEAVSASFHSCGEKAGPPSLDITFSHVIAASSFREIKVWLI
jgi:histone H3/H4